MRQKKEMSADEEQFKTDEQMSFHDNNIVTNSTSAQSPIPAIQSSITESCSDDSAVGSSSLIQSSSQTPQYLSSKTPRKQKLQKEISENKVKINQLKKQVMALSN